MAHHTEKGAERETEEASNRHNHVSEWNFKRYEKINDIYARTHFIEFSYLFVER